MTAALQLPISDPTQEDTMTMTTPTQAPTDEQIGRSVRAAREAFGITQAEMARRLRARGITVHNSLVSGVEAGNRRLYFAEAVAIADVLGVELAELMDYQRVADEREVAELRARLAELTARLGGHAG